jgi:hypothetical protein
MATKIVQPTTLDEVDTKLRELVKQLDIMRLEEALWWFIENGKEVTPVNTALFFYLRERVKGARK